MSGGICPVRLDVEEIFENDTRRMSLPAIHAHFQFRCEKFHDPVATDESVCGANSMALVSSYLTWIGNFHPSIRHRVNYSNSRSARYTSILGQGTRRNRFLVLGVCIRN